MKMNYLGVLMLFWLGSTSLFSQSFQNALDKVFLQMQEENKISENDTHWVLTSQHVSSVSGIQHVYFQQTLNGLPINGTQSSIHLLPNGTMLKANVPFVGNASDKARSAASPSITALQAVENAASYFGYRITGDLSVVEQRNQEVVISKGGISLSEIPVALVYQITEEGDLALAWDLSIEEKGQQDWWSVRVDANTGQILDQVNWMSQCNFEHDHSVHETLDYNKNLFDVPNYCEILENESTMAPPNSYEVFAMPIESPYFGSRTVETSPWNTTASPFGWHDTNGASGAEFTVTKGNNVDAYEDGNNPGFQPDGGGTLDFTGYPFSQIYTNGNQYESAAITNLFYWNNIIHDVMYMYGFDEAGGNFQENNYGNGGAGSDSVNAEAQDGSGTCNANFGTPSDGSNPRMQMYVCSDKDGDFDNLVIIHEYGHGISNRLTGGPGAAGCLGNSEQMGEGWSDWYGVMMTMEPGDTGTDARAVGTYLFGQGPGGNGIRSFPYTTDMGVNPQTYDYIKTESVPHGVGSVWATMLWELTWGLIDEYGWDADIYNFTGDVNLDAGNVQAMALVTEAMKLQPCSPGFIDGRDAIFAADQAIYGGANTCIIWDAFAKRGLGVSADQGSSSSRSDGTQAFDTPSQTAAMVAQDDVCENEEALTDLTGGTPVGGTYSGPGVTDNGDGLTFTFDPAVAGVGVHNITYDVPATNCSVASSDTNTIEVLAIPAGPDTTGVDDFCPGEEVTISATPIDPLNVIRWYDAEVGGTFLAQGNSYAFTPTGDTSVFAQETPDTPLSQLVISEITLQTPDQLEIQNVGLAADYTGYAVATSDTPYGNINAVNPVVQILGNMGADSVENWNDDGGAGYWGSNLFWNDNEPGWIIIIDDQGNVVDSVFWNTSASEIATLNVSINGFNITAADLDWSGVGAGFTQGCSQSYRRVDDNDNASNWPDVCLASDYGTANTDIDLGIDGCLGARTETFVTEDSVDPDLTCPADLTVIVQAGESYTLPDYTLDATATDNCTASPSLSQSPAAGTDVSVGVHLITITAADDSGNEVDCTFELTVDEELGTNDFDINSVALYPNPTTGLVSIATPSQIELQQITVMDINGRIVQVYTNKNEMQVISMSDLASGTYFIQIQTQGASLVKRVVKR